MLVLAGGGLYRGHFTVELMEVLKRADIVYVEDYTMPSGTSLVDEVRRINPSARRASRRLLEEGVIGILSEARDKLVVIVTGGHPLIATTHISVIAEAKSMGINVKVLQGVSGVVAAMTISGLDFYKYGRTITIPGPWRGVEPYSIIEYIYMNTLAGLHTLALLDIDEDGRQLCIWRALEVLASLDRLEVLKGVDVIIVEDAGLETEKVWHTRIGVAGECQKGIASIILPLAASRIEAEMLDRIYGIKLDLGRLEVLRRKIRSWYGGGLRSTHNH